MFYNQMNGNNEPLSYLRRVDFRSESWFGVVNNQWLTVFVNDAGVLR
jgi:hypothetical protein